MAKKFSWIFSFKKRYIFIKVNLNVYTVVIKFYPFFYKYKNSGNS